MTNPNVRRATVADSDALAAVYRGAYRENRELGFPAKAGSATPSTVAEWIEAYHVYVAEIDDDVVGGARLDLAGSDPAELARLGVHEARKGAGIGSELLDRAEHEARERGHVTIRLTTPGEHPYLPNFYRRRGYEVTGDHPLEYRDYDEVVMEKRLR